MADASAKSARAARIADLERESTEKILHSRLGVKRTPRFSIGETGKAWIALIPALIFLIVFMIYPILNTFIMSFMENFTFVGGSKSSFAITNFIAALNNSRTKVKPSIGFGNYVHVFQDVDFKKSLLNTALMVIVSIPLTIIISLLIAVLLNSIKPLRAFFQTVFFLPYVTNTIALGMVFKIIFSSNKGGMVNSLIAAFGGSAQEWLTDGASRWAMFFVLVLYSVWNGLAFKILVFQSGLASIDKQYYDAAKIDGASRATILRRITVPLLSPQMLYITITSFIGAFKAYTQVISLFGGRASEKNFFGGATGKEWETVVGYIYLVMTDTTMIGRAAAASFILLVIILIITVFQTIVSKKRVVY